MDSHDKTYPPRQHLSPSGIDLAEWVRRQRDAAKAGALSIDRRRRLDEVPGWSWKIRHRQHWDECYSELAAYAREHGTANPVQGIVTTSGFALGHWVSAQRVAYGRGTMARNFPERIEQLEALPGWAWNVSDALWETGFADLQAFTAATGCATPGRSAVGSSGLRLGHWAKDQRKKYRRGQLSPERSARLEQLPGWFWEKRPTTQT